MSYKKAFISHMKSLTEKKYSFMNKSTKISTQLNDFQKLENQPLTSIVLYKITFKNLKKYTTTKRTYNKFIINSIIFDHRIHKVAVFKNNLLWDESSEFLKRFYKKKESKERIPKISEYYEKYTLFPPVYFGLEGLIVIIMNKWTKKKKNYLEYVEDHEEDKKKIKTKESFEPLINSSSLNNITSFNKSFISKNTLELTKFENESKKSLMNKNKNDNKNKNHANNGKNKIDNLSFSDIMDDLSSNYSVIINTDRINYDNKDIHNLKEQQKIKKLSNKDIDKTRNLFYLNKKTLNISNNNKTNFNITAKKLNVKNAEYSPRKYVKISLNKKNNKLNIKNNNPNIIFRNNNNFNMPIPSVKKYQKRFMNTENIKKINLINKNISKGTIRVNTISNYIQNNKNKVGNENNNILQNNDKEHSASLKKYNNFNYAKNNTNYNLVLSYKNHYISSNNHVKEINSSEKNKIIKNKNNILKKKNFIQIKKEPFLSINNINNSLNKYKQSTFRNQISNYNYTQEMISNPNISKHNLISNIPKINMDLINTNKIKEMVNNKKLYLEDPFIYKLSQLNKKKTISLTTANSLTKNKNMSINGFHSIIGNNYSNINNSKNKLKLSNKKNLVLSKINTKSNLVYNKKRKISGDNSIRNNSANSTLIPKNNDSALNFNISNKKTNGWKNNTKNINSKNINLNLNLNIHFNIGLENKNKGRKILLNNTIINQLQNKTNKNQKYSNLIKNKEKDINYKYPLTSRNSNSHIKDFIDMNKIEYTLSKK